ncbi:hypothetical protein MMC22_009017 [Lobaria immixta]|nr:hypothetical protein [Lobaria immixta]
MQFSASFLAAALPLLAASAPAPAASSGPIGLIAIHSASPIHLSSVNAAGQNFYIGKDTSSYCPLTPPLSCPPGKSTVISVFEDQAHPGTAAMDVFVPGGQQIYIRSNGALGYTQAHSASIPPRAITTGFTYTRPRRGAQFGTFDVSLPGSTGLLACPLGARFSGPYQVFVNLNGLKDSDVAGGKINKCISFYALAIPTNGPDAWQYT